MTSNQSLNERPYPIGKYFKYSTPRWVSNIFWIFIGFAGITSTGAAFDQHGHHNAMFALVSLMFLLVFIMEVSNVLRGEESIYFMCDKNGVYFPSCEIRAREAENWLVVPWTNISNIRAGHFSFVSNEAVAFSIRLTPTEEGIYFRSKWLQHRREYADGSFLVDYLCDYVAAPSAKNIVKAMIEFKSQWHNE